MDAHRREYLEAKGYFTEIVAHLLSQLKSIDPALHATTASSCIFRINKNDFSKKGEAPYKGYFSAGISPGGRHSQFANYVFALEPDGRSRAGGGIRKPTAAQLARVRQEIDYNPGELENILTTPTFAATFGQLQGAVRQTAPKGYAKSHPAINLLKYNGFQVLRFFPDEEVLQPDFIHILLPLYQQVLPLHRFLNATQTDN